MFVSDRRWPQLGWPARGPCDAIRFFLWYGLSALSAYTECLTSLKFSIIDFLFRFTISANDLYMQKWEKVVLAWLGLWLGAVLTSPPPWGAVGISEGRLVTEKISRFVQIGRSLIFHSMISYPQQKFSLGMAVGGQTSNWGRACPPCP